MRSHHLQSPQAKGGGARRRQRGVAPHGSVHTIPWPYRPDPLSLLAAVFDCLHDSKLLAALWLVRAGSRPGYPLRPLWRAYVASFVLNLGSTNDLIRRLHADKGLRRVCGFGDRLPHRTTFGRFIGRLSHHTNLVAETLAGVTAKLREALPGLGQEVAVDSTFVRTHGNPNRRPLADRDAWWTVKHSTQAKEGGQEWRYGYKVHLAVDANSGIPLGMKVTPANVTDTTELPGLMDATLAALPWLRQATRAVIADRGYDSITNFQYLHGKDIDAIILIRRPNNKTNRHDGTYTLEGTPMCLGQVPMEYVRTDPQQGHLFRCVGCHLAGTRKGVRYCNDEVWEDPEDNLRIVGDLPRETPEWKALYAKRWSIERTFKSMKQSRRLERHYHRGLRLLTIHCYMSVLTYSATALVTAQQGRVQPGALRRLRWMTERVP